MTSLQVLAESVLVYKSYIPLKVSKHGVISDPYSVRKQENMDQK